MKSVDKPLVTIYITNYNYAQYLEAAIESVNSQTFRDFELIVIDDCSNDDSLIKLARLRKRYGFKLYSGVKRGLNKTNNFALSKAKGKYLVRLDADDILHSAYLGVITALLEADPKVSLAFPNYFLINKFGEVYAEERRNNFRDGIILKDRPAHGACTMIRVEDLRAAGGYFDDVSCQDGYDLWLKLGVNREVIHVPIPLFYYRQHGENLTTDNSKIIRCRREIKKRFIGTFQKEKILDATIVVPIKKDYWDKVDFDEVQIYFNCLSKNFKDLNINIDFTLLTSSLEKSGNLIGSKRIYRPEELEMPNVDLKHSMKLLKETQGDWLKENIIVLNIIEALPDFEVILECLITLQIFQVSAIMTVTRDRGKLYVHRGNGLTNIVENTGIHWERNEIFRAVSSVYAFPKYRNFKESLLGNCIGHVEVIN